jgi:hypothetical protein
MLTVIPTVRVRVRDDSDGGGDGDSGGDSEHEDDSEGGDELLLEANALEKLHQGSCLLKWYGLGSTYNLPSIPQHQCPTGHPWSKTRAMTCSIALVLKVKLQQS